MVKSLYLYIYLGVHALLSIGCIQNASGSNTKHDKVIPVVNTTNVEIVEVKPKECVLNKAKSFVGTKEIGYNKDFTNPELRNLLETSGWKEGQAWCSFILKGILDDCNIPNKVTGWSPTSYNKSDVIFTDGKFQQYYNNDDILVMSLSYNKYMKDKNRYKGIGHTGIIEQEIGGNIYTYEGNTDEDGGREGNGFYRKVRPLSSKIHITRYGK